ncbi:MAG: exodeoxyribonuclease V subunit gamma [Bacilli bacterium]|nr:exodeoxyribonuclease V subunit gamma [Bacilli bacterium]
MQLKNELNEKQYEAVTSRSRFLRIIAGAGSGKTRVLTYRIAYLISELGVEPFQILAITFTNKVAKEMKERTAKLLPDFNLNGLTISTFHSFCAMFLRREIEAMEYSRNFIIYDEEDQKRLVKMIAESFGHKKSDEIVDDALSFIGYYKAKGELPGDVNVVSLPEHKRKLFNFFVEYEKRKAEAKALDFDDLLIYTIKILENFPDVREKYASKFLHILIDEFQDTDNVQYKLLRLLCGRRTNVYVVGDPDQTIYTWRGANQDIILNIEDDFYPMETIILNENYRSTTPILNAANKLISHNKKRVPKDLYTKRESSNNIVLKIVEKPEDEGKFVAGEIRQLMFHNKDLKYSDFAVLYRSAYLSLKIENALTSQRIPYKVYGGTKFYSRKEIKDCLAYFRLLLNEDDDVSFERIINVPRRKIGETSVTIIKKEAGFAGLSMYKYVKNVHKYDSELKPNVINSLFALFEVLDETRAKLDQNLEAYSEVLDEFLNKIKYKDYLEEDDETKDKIENVRALIDDVRSYLKGNPESNFADYLQNVTLLSAQDEIENSDNVNLMTVHTAKGLEFKYVFVIGLNQGVFPNSRAVDDRREEGLEEERRLAYVAFTRAKDFLYVTLNRGYSFQAKENLTPSMFISEAGLQVARKPLESLYNSSNERLYRYNPYSELDAKRAEVQKNIVDLSKNNGIKWNVGDLCIHKVFGEGKVTEVVDEFIVVNFVSYGVKRLLGSHPTLSKKE